MKFGGVALGGIKIGALSNLDKPLTISLTVTKGKRAPHSVDVLPELSPIDALKAEWYTATPERQKAIEAEVAALQGGAA